MTTLTHSEHRLHTGMDASQFKMWVIHYEALATEILDVVLDEVIEMRVAHI